MSVGQWLQEVLAGQWVPRPQEDGARPAFAARKNPDQYFLNPSEILSHCSPEVCALGAGLGEMPCSACAPCVIDPGGFPQGMLQCSPWAQHQHRILGFGCHGSLSSSLSSWVSFPSIFMAAPVQRAGFLRLCHRGRWTQTGLFQAIPPWIPLHLLWEEPLEPKAMAKGIFSPMAKLIGSICCLLGHLQCQQGPGALCTLTLCYCLFLVFH